jgi:hypothetical protein
MNPLVTRRSVLVAGASAGAILSLGFGFKWMGRAAENSKVLSQIELDVVEKASGVLFPPGVFSISGGEGFTAPEVDRLLADVVDPNVVTPFRVMLGALEWGTLVSRGQRFSSLTLAEAKDVLDIWASENPFPRRIAFDSLQAILGLAFLRRAEVLDDIGWRAGCFG